MPSQRLARRSTTYTGQQRRGASLGIHPYVADALLNHKDGTIRGAAAVYNRYAYIDERHCALEAWDRRERR